MNGPVAKIVGLEMELGNSLCPAVDEEGTDGAARMLLAEIDGWPSSDVAWREARDGRRAGAQREPSNPQEWARRYLPGGGCAYEDLEHCEVVSPCVRSARDLVCRRDALLDVARAAQRAASTRLRDGQRLIVTTNASDRNGSSWGSGHMNFLTTRRLWEEICLQLYPKALLLASFQCSLILFSGTGKVGAENGRPAVDFQLSQRADFIGQVAGGTETTTQARQLVNARWQPLVGQSVALARWHDIAHEAPRNHIALMLRTSCAQLVLAALESGWCDKSLALDDPLATLVAWGHDPGLRTPAALIDGRTVTILDHQELFLDAARRFVADGGAEGVVPEAELIVNLWQSTLDALRRRDLVTAARRLDWVLKRVLLERMADRHGLTWNSPEIRAADILFASLGEDSLFDAVAARGGVDMLVTRDEIARAVAEPPQDTRAWGRTRLLRSVRRREIVSIDWDGVVLRPLRPGGPPRVVRFDDPRETRAEVECRLGLIDLQPIALAQGENNGEGHERTHAFPTST